MSVVNELKAEISSGAIKFDPPASVADRLRREMLGENEGAKATARL